jgi:hypothetical protein
MCCCDSVARASAGAFGMAARQQLLLQQLAPGGWVSRGACAERKFPEKQGAGLLLASSSTLRSCLGQARAFLTRRNHLSACARWADPNLRFSLIPMSTPPTPVNLQIALLFLRLALVLRLHLRLEEL